MASSPSRITWVILTMGDRAEALGAAVRSVREHGGSSSELLVVSNGGPLGFDGVSDGEVLAIAENVGVPGGRDQAARSVGTDLVGFLDDDARLLPGAEQTVLGVFDDLPSAGAVAMRIVDEDGGTSRRHVPRIGSKGAARPGHVATFLGGACAVRRSAYLDAGGYWPELWYGHEELDLAWRMADAGYSIVYEPLAMVAHPKTEIGRHVHGWYRTGRNRVLVARRNLPLPVLLAHTTIWLAAGLLRAPSGARRGYVAGWWSGWSAPVERHPIAWRTVWRLTVLGRPPLV